LIADPAGGAYSAPQILPGLRLKGSLRGVEGRTGCREKEGMGGEVREGKRESPLSLSSPSSLSLPILPLNGEGKRRGR